MSQQHHAPSALANAAPLPLPSSVDVPGSEVLEAIWREMSDEARDRIGVRAITWAIYEALQYEDDRFSFEAVNGLEHRASEALSDLSVLGLQAANMRDRALGQ